MIENLFSGPTLLILFAIIFMWVLFVLSLQRALDLCETENRSMEPIMVWLLSIPVLNVYWMFRVINEIEKALKLEFQKRGLGQRRDYGKKYGLWSWVLTFGALIFMLFYLLFLSVPYFFVFSYIFGFTGIFFWIVYWIKINLMSNKLFIQEQA
ncbi:MAG: hypothetical protein NT007_10950 [Candidatus Kapabacteria bacterium]|nr:hypothetical protein [Candidatus Kapabacteria bacterium]